MLTLTDALKLLLLSDAEPVRAAVRASCLPPHEVELCRLAGLLHPNSTLAAYGESIMQKAKAVDALLIDWSLEQAPLINTVCHVMHRQRTFVPVIALCSGSQEEMIAALAAGVDDVASLPLFIPLFQARVIAYQRLIRAVRRATVKRIKKKLAAKPHFGKALARQTVSALIEEMAAEREPSFDAVEALVEGMAGEFIEEVDQELILAHPEHEVLTVGKLRLDRTAYRVYLAGDEVDLTPKEFELLSYLMRQAGRLCSRDLILEEVWGIDFDTGTNMIDVYMHFLRKKLAAHGFGQMLQTVRGRGYRLVVPEVTAE